MMLMCDRNANALVKAHTVSDMFNYHVTEKKTLVPVRVEALRFS
jgi:hypothetical protein